VIPVLWAHLIFNLLLQVFDGLLTYHVLSLGVPEANPLVSTAIVQWGAAWGLLCWKTFACILLVLIFALRHRRQALTMNAFTVTAMVYGWVSFLGVCELLRMGI
jgi:hypothetical protein